MTVEQRLARLEAIEAIRQLKHRYFQACDRKQPERVRECFAEGEVALSYGRIGAFSTREQLLEVYTELACNDHIVEIHHGQNPVIELEGENHGTGQWGLYYYLIDTRRQRVTQLAGFYEDAYVRVQGDWKICRSSYEVTSTQIMDLSEGMARAIFAGRAAPSELDDPNEQAVTVSGESTE